MPKLMRSAIKQVSLSAIVIVGLASVCFTLIGANGPVPIGIVQHASGKWTASPSGKSLVRGQMVAANESVVPGVSNKGSIAILIFNTGEVWRKECTSASPCEESSRLPGNGKSENSGFWSFFTGYFNQGQEPPPIFAGSRSLTRGGPVHALLVVNHGQIDLEPALQKLPEGKYTIELAKESDQSTAEPSKHSINWKPGSNLQITAPAAGLYALEIMANGESVGSPVALLIVAASATRQQATWKEVNDRVAQWSSADARTVDTVLLATLVALQKEGGHQANPQ